MPFPINETTRRFAQDHFSKRGRKKNFEWSEDFFLNAIQTSENKYDVYWSVLALRDCGTARSIPALKSLVSYPMKDVKSCTILTIAHIAGDVESLFYGEMLVSSEYREKGYAMWAIKDAADVRAADYVITYFQANRAKLRAGKLSNGTVVDGIQYLFRMRDSHTGAATFLNGFHEYWNRIAEGERTELHKRIPEFAGAMQTVSLEQKI